MRIVGLICLILGVIAGANALATKQKQSGNVAYDKGAKLGRGSVPVIFISLGLWLLLRNNRGVRSTQTSLRPASSAPVPPSPVFPAQIPVKIQCGCGQHYAFDVEPVNGRMPAAIACPSCRADGTEAANAVIAQTLAARMDAMARSQPAVRQGRKLHPAWIVGSCAAALLLFLIAASIVSKLIGFSRAARLRSGAEQKASGPTEPSRIVHPQATTRPNDPSGRPINSMLSKPGSGRDAVPIPTGMMLIDVFWGNRWWPAVIIRRDGERAFIHYEGWSSSSDEWVTPERMRPRR